MRFSEILSETPALDPNEMPQLPLETSFFITEETLKREYIFVRELIIDGIPFYVFIKDDLSSAVLGEGGVRDGDEKSGIYVDGEVTFHHKVDIGVNDAVLSDKTLQVSNAYIHENNRGRKISKARGLGYWLYHSLLIFGIVLVSDTLHYRGGQALWKKLAKRSSVDGYSVYVLDNGEFITDQNGEPIKYDGTNISDEVIWSNGSDKNKYVLLVARMN